MAGTSAQISVPSCQVFVSHRGLFIKQGFADQLYEDLKESGISTFLDMETLPVGQDVRKIMLPACGEAQIHVPIFTPNYGTSEWCLDELAKMMECKDLGLSTVIPVYLRMEPDDLRTATSLFSLKFEEFIRGNKFEDRRSRWKKALTDASWLEAFRLSYYGGRQGMLTKELVKKIREEVSNKIPADEDRDKVGLVVKVQELVQTFRLGEHTTSVFVLLIWGMGGIGKTTLARATYDHLKKTFDEASFVDKCYELKDPTELQRRLRADLLHDRTSDGTGGMAEARGRLRYGLREKRVLIVLDDVKDFGFVEDAIQLKNLRPGSLILVTSRDSRAVPHRKDLDHPALTGVIYELPPMDPQDSFTLFCLHAFRESKADPSYEKLAEQCVKACGGLPLSLKVLGQHLSRRMTVGQWREAISKLKSSKLPDVWKSLDISYVDLDDYEKEMFQDVACFFIGVPVLRAKQFWAATTAGEPETGLENLKQRCLVKVDKNLCLSMHDQLRDLGRYYSGKSKTRFLNGEDLRPVLDAGKGLDQIRGIVTSQERLSTNDLLSMRALQLLFLNGTTLIGRSGQHTSLPSLRWLKWQRCPHPTLPENLSLSLAVLELELVVDTLWIMLPSITDTERLRVLDIWSATRGFSTSTWRETTGCHAKYERCFMTNLEKLYTSRTLVSSMGKDEWERPDGFIRLSSYLGFDKSQFLGFLENSVCVRIGGFKSCTRLPTSVGLWNGIRFLWLVGLSRLEELPHELGSLASLELLCARSLRSIKQLPPSLGHLKRLLVLDIGQCERLQELPEDLGSLVNLRELLVDGLESITRLPSSLRLLKSLLFLNVSGCMRLQELPEDLGSLVSLTALLAKDLESITHLPSSLGQLKMLQVLNVNGCKRLQGLPEDLGFLESLEELHLRDLELIRSLPSLRHCKRLQILNINGCKMLQELPEDLGCLESLEKLFAKGLNWITYLPPSLSHLKMLQVLKVNWCNQLQGLPEDLGSLKSLEKLHAVGLELITRLPSSLSELKRLQNLDISRCMQLQELPEGLGFLGSLEKLHAIGLVLIKRLPSSLSQLKRLRILDISWCNQLQELPEDLGSLKSLEKLHAVGLKLITRLPSSLSQLKSLQNLNIGKCWRLKELPKDLGFLENLEELRVSYLKLITRLPSSLSQLKRLRILDISLCNQLQELPEDLGSLKSLEKLHAIGLELITRLPSSLSQLKSLQDLSIGGCWQLKELPEALGFLENLESLNVSDLKLITRLPSSLSQLKRLMFLNISRCTGLQELPEDFGSLKCLRLLTTDGLESIIQLPSSLSHLKRL